MTKRISLIHINEPVLKDLQVSNEKGLVITKGVYKGRKICIETSLIRNNCSTRSRKFNDE